MRDIKNYFRLMALGVSLSTALFANSGEKMILTSPDFKDMMHLPQNLTCYGEGVLPTLYWEDAPTETKSFVLILDDPDAVGGKVWNHWIVYDIPATTTKVEKGTLPKEAKIGKSTNAKNAYVAPCPPKGSGEHGYRFSLYALDTAQISSQGDSKEAILDAIKGHILAEARLIGKYEKKKKFLFF